METTKNRAILIVIAIAIIGAFLAFCLRSPVLLVVDESFSALYGKDRAQKARFFTSLCLYRWVKPVLVADDASPDVLVLAVVEASKRPYCVVFPYRYADEARRYSEQNPQRTVVLLAGRSNAENYRLGQAFGDSGESQRFFVYNTDGRLDFYRAGRIAGLFGKEKWGDIPVFIDRMGKMADQDAFLQGLLVESCESPPRFYASFAQLGTPIEYTVVVLSGSGVEYLESSPQSPIIMFSWIDPAITNREIRVIFDDSPWAQLLYATQLAQKGKDGEAIPSKIMIFPDRIADKRIMRGAGKAARSRMGKAEEQP